MKKSNLIITAVAVILALILSFAGCGSDSVDETSTAPDASVAIPADASPLLTAVLDGFVNNKSYADYKSYYPDAEFSESIEGDSIVIKIDGVDEIVGIAGTDGDYTYTLDGDYITYVSSEQDYTGPSMLMFIADSVADYLGMSKELVSGYILAVSSRGIENDYFLVQTDDATGETTYMLYVGGAYDLSLIDDMYIDDTALEYTDALTEDSMSSAVNVGKIISRFDGSADEVRIAVGEYGENTELTYKSVRNLVAKLQPVGYEDFAAEYTQLDEVQTDEYSVTFGLDDEAVESGNFDGLDAYSFVIVTFGK